jgi:hypothetical protein
VIRAVYWGSEPKEFSPIAVSWPVRGALGLCSFGLLWLGIFPGSILNLAMLAAQSLF